VADDLTPEPQAIPVRRRPIEQVVERNFAALIEKQGQVDEANARADAAERQRDAILDAVQRRGDPATLALVGGALGSADLVHDTVTAETALGLVWEIVAAVVGGADPVVAVGLISGIVRRAHPDSDESLRARRADLQGRLDESASDRDRG
jgi:hypothetical protein